MERRDFIKVSASVAALAATSSVSGCKGKKVTVETNLDVHGYMEEPAKRIPVIASADVVVVGGGPAGVAAAVSAAREGASVIMIERYNHLGGLWTGGLVLATNCTHGLSSSGEFSRALYGFTFDVLNELRALDLLYGDVNAVVDPEACKYVLEKLIRDSGVRVLYHSFAVGVISSADKIDGVIIESKSGRNVVRAKTVVDSTGDGDVMSWVGEKFDLITYHCGMNFRLGNIDRIDSSAPYFSKVYTGASSPIKSVNWYNSFGYKDVDATNLMQLSKVQSDLRMESWNIYFDIKSHPGYEEVFYLDSASQIGTRASRILSAKYKLKYEDTMTFRSFEDSIGVSGGWCRLPYKGQAIEARNRPIWQIPYRALVPQSVKNLLIAGRCFSFEKELLEDAREIGTCIVTGQGAGVAAAISSRQNIDNASVDIAQLQNSLRKQNVKLE